MAPHSADTSNGARAVVLHVSGSTWRFRLATYLRSLRRPRGFLPILVVALLPVAIDRAVSFAVAGDGTLAQFTGIGVAAAVGLVVVGAAAAVLRRARPSTFTFHDRGIREETGGRVLEHPWSWIVDVSATAGGVTLRCQEPMRSFQLARSSGTRVLVIDGAHPERDRLGALIAAHTPFTVS